MRFGRGVWILLIQLWAALNRRAGLTKALELSRHVVGAAGILSDSAGGSRCGACVRAGSDRVVHLG
jgi:hypothetical protein